MGWKYFYSSVKGTSHETNNTPRQDNCSVTEFVISNIRYLVSSVADGAGSAKHSDLSSKFICKLFTRKVKQWLENKKQEEITKETVSEWFLYFQKVVERAAGMFKLESSREFATTLLFSVLSENCNIFVQIGDGIIATGNENALECVFLPQNGEYLNTTHFATEKDVSDIFMFKMTFEPVKYIAMHTDGIEQVAFDFATQKPFTKFFTPFFNILEKVENCGYSENISKQLELFLKSEKINQKTDDDKTLFIAVSECLADNSVNINREVTV